MSRRRPSRNREKYPCCPVPPPPALPAGRAPCAASAAGPPFRASSSAAPTAARASSPSTRRPASRPAGSAASPAGFPDHLGPPSRRAVARGSARDRRRSAHRAVIRDDPPRGRPPAHDVGVPATLTLDRTRLAALMEREMATFLADHPRSAGPVRARQPLAPGRRADELDGQVGRAPSRSSSSRRRRPFHRVDGHDYVDLCLGDTGAMAGHGAAATIAAVERQLPAAASPTCSRPRTPSGVGEELQRRFGLRTGSSR